MPVEPNPNEIERLSASIFELLVQDPNDNPLVVIGALLCCLKDFGDIVTKDGAPPIVLHTVGSLMRGMATTIETGCAFDTSELEATLDKVREDNV